MKDPRINRLAKNLITHSTALKRGETVLIEAFDIPDELIIELIREAKKKGARPLVSLKSNGILRELIRNTTAEHMSLTGDYEFYDRSGLPGFASYH